MVPKVARSGRSFKGAAAYYLHDKGAQTSERVAFTETVNLPTDDPRKAVAHMIDTATHAEQLKQAAGMKAGRKLTKPVYAYSLAWHPDQKPSQADQIAAARESLQALGLSDRQALIVSHNDQAHPHVHVIVNRVCPETGKAASMSNDRLKLSQWAEDYEKRHGKVYCEARVDNNEARARGDWRKDDSPSRRDHAEWKKAESAQLWAEYWRDKDAAKDSRKGQYDALWRQKSERVALRKDEIRQVFKPYWRDLFKEQRRQLKEYDNHLAARLKFAVRQSKESRVKALFQAMTKDQAQRSELLGYQAQQRQELSTQQRGRVIDASREVTKAWRYDRDQLKALHKEQDRQRLETTRTRQKELWQDRPFGQSKPAFDHMADRRKKENTQQREAVAGKEDSIKKARAEKQEAEKKAKARSRGRTRRRPRN